MPPTTGPLVLVESQMCGAELHRRELEAWILLALLGRPQLEHMLHRRLRRHHRDLEQCLHRAAPRRPTPRHLHARSHKTVELSPDVLDRDLHLRRRRRVGGCLPRELVRDVLQHHAHCRHLDHSEVAAQPCHNFHVGSCEQMRMYVRFALVFEWSRRSRT